MHHWICTTCGTQYPASQSPPDGCLICLDERQYVGHEGQKWTHLDEMQAGEYRNTVTEVEPGLFSIRTEPKFAIGQRALLVRTPEGNILWDCISYLDQETIDRVRELGGIKAIAISHPHYYSSLNEWAAAFGAPVYLHEADREWVMRPGERIRFWSGERLELAPGVTAIRLGGHFPGSAALHWQAGAGGQGALLTGDTIYVVADRNWVSFMYSYPNVVPLPAWEVRRMAQAVGAYGFDRIYGAWPESVVPAGAAAAVQRSAARYIAALERTPDQSGRSQ